MGPIAMILGLDASSLALAMTVALLAGFIKGAIGFGMPMVLFSGLATILPVELAVAGLILPTVVSNGFQAFRQGWAEAVASIRKFWRFSAILFVTILLSAQLITQLPRDLLLIMLGLFITVFAILQIIGWAPQMAGRARIWVETGMALIGGFFGGMTGIWGPPTVLYLTALNTPKTESVRVQGVMYGAGSLILLVSHLKSGVLNASTAPFSALLVVPAIGATLIGFRMQDRMNQALFRKATLGLLVIAGLNLLRRGIWG